MTHHTNTAPLATWLTLSEAAALLGCSVRTIERRIAENTYTVQYDSRGRRLVDMTREAEARQTDSQALHAAGMEARKEATQLAHTMNAMIEWHKGEAERLIQDAKSARRVARVMGVVAAAAVAVCVGGVAYVMGSQSDMGGAAVALPRQSDTVSDWVSPSKSPGGGLPSRTVPHGGETYPDTTDNHDGGRVGYATQYDITHDIPPLLLPQ